MRRNAKRATLHKMQRPSWSCHPRRASWLAPRRVRLPEDPGLLQPVFSAASAHLTSLNLHPAAPAFHPAYDPKPVPSTAAAPAQLAQLTSLQHLQLGHYISEYFEGWWRPPSVAMLSGLAGELLPSCWRAPPRQPLPPVAPIPCASCAATPSLLTPPLRLSPQA